MLFIGLTMLGYISYKNLPVELFPSVELPMMIVQVNAIQDVDPSYVEQQAIIPLEGVVGTLEGIESIDSYADYRSGMIYITYKDGTDIKYAFLKLQEKIESIKSTLTENFVVNVLKVDTDQISNQFMDIEVRGTGGVDRVRNVTDEDIKDELESIDGIASVEIFGGREKSIEIILDKDEADAYNITPSQISQLINRNNQQRVFAGVAKETGKEYFVNVTAESSQLSDLENIVVRTEGPIRLKDVAKIFFGVKEEDSYSRVNGKESVTIRLIRDSQSNLINLSHKVQETIADLNSKLAGKDIEIVVQRNTAEEMENNINSIIDLAIQGGLLAIIVLWIFLRNVRLVLVIGLSIPISIFAAFNFFYAYDISVNSLTLIGMALAIGMLVDNSVVVLENIYRLAGTGKKAEEAVVQGTTEVWRSIAAATLTTVAVFTPFLFSSNFLVKTFGSHIGVSIISTLLVSLALALFLIPMLTHKVIGQNVDYSRVFKNVSNDNRLMQIYLVLLKACMRFPTRTIIGAVVIFFASLLGALAISTNVSQEVESDTFNLYIQMPEGSSLEMSDEVARKVEERLDGIEEKQDVISKIYEDQSTITIKLKDDYTDINNKTIEEIKEDISGRLKRISDAEISFDEPQSSQRFRGGAGANMGNRFQRMLGIGSQTERVVIKGNNYNSMLKTAEDIQYYLENLSSVQSARVSVAGERPEIHLLFDPYLLTVYNIPISSIASELATFRSEFSSNTTFKQGTDEYDITIKTDDIKLENKDKTADELRALKIPDNSGNYHELQEISKIVLAEGMASINRVNQEKQIEVTYRLLTEVNDSKALLDQARLEIDEMVAGLTIPAGIAVEVLHDETEFEEYYFLIIVAILLIYFILASVFESFSTPVVLMFSIPLAAIGSLVALIFTGNSILNSNTLTGFLILLGVVVNNGIILIDYSNILRKRGYSLQRALITAGLARVRPILITAITTIVAMIPLALGEMEYVASIGAPFAITVIGGLSVSSLFTLIFIPTFYSGLDSAIKWFFKLSIINKLLQGLSLIAVSALIYFEVDSLIWQFASLFAAIVIIPGFTYFMMNSLRQAKTKLIKSNDEIKIEVKNTVKVYDQQSRFVREWNRGKNSTKNEKLNFKEELVNSFIWQIPLLAFTIYFTYWYLENQFWKLVNVHIVFFLALFVMNSLRKIFSSGEKPVYDKISGLLEKLRKPFIWLFPLFNLVLFYFGWNNIALVIFIAAVWYAGILINSTSNKIFSENFDEDAIKGRTASLRRKYYDIVRMTPIIGKKKKPFKALNKVTLDIGSGMFGLLGPNGAGKTTLMRIICGILDQSYGKVRFNGLDRSVYREELQGLIGYLPQEFGMYENMSAYDFLDYKAMLKGIVDKKTREERVNKVLNSVHMFEKRNDKIGSFSGGMKQRIGIAQILLHLPKILVVDEPTAGLDPRERIRFRNLLVELSRERIVIFSTHIIEDISSSCNRVAVMNQGEVKYLGEPAKMTKIAEGKVWQFHVTQKQFTELQDKLVIVNHMRDGDRIRIRCINETASSEDAKEIRATLEDAYLYLQRKNKTSIFS